MSDNNWPENMYFSKASDMTPSNMEELYKEYGVMGMTRISAGGRTFVPYDNDVSVKSDYRKVDYDYFRTADSIPTSPEKVIDMCMAAYSKIGIVRNVIDLMADFACQGIRIQHPIKSQERFLNKWFRKVRGKERSERFLNLLYRSANVFVYSMYGRVPAKIQKKWKSTTGEIRLEEAKTKNLEIPLQYSFLNPSCIAIVGGEFASLSDNNRYALKLDRLRTSIDFYGGGDEVLEKLFEEVRQKVDPSLLQSVDKKSQYFPLPKERTSAYFYKKDDWKSWAEPMVYPILNDLILLEKMKLADMSALDGAISNIRLWNMGHLDGPKGSIIPTKATLDKLRNILANSVGGGTLELVWGPELKFTESSTNVHQFLGSEKYKPILDAIYDGLGIPQTLRSGTANTNTNTTMALKTLIERLQYARDILLEFWNEQLKIVQQAMGFKQEAKVVFENMTLSDEAAEKKLLMDLADRDIISMESLREKFNIQDNIETKRVRKELRKRRDDADTPNKASPFHVPQVEDEIKKGLVNNGFAAPSEVGIHLKDKSPEDNDRQAQFVKRQQEMKPKSDNTGRPRNVTETRKRKPKPKNKPRSTANISLSMWADRVQEKLSDIITPAFLHAYSRKNVRSMTNKEVEHLERTKLIALFNLEPYEEIDVGVVSGKMAEIDNDYFSLVLANIEKVKRKCMTYNKELTVAELRKIYSEVFVLMKDKNKE
jgi:hypothetical protein